MIAILGFLIVTLVAVYVALPLVHRSDEPWAVDADAGENLRWRRDTLYRELADLDFDFRSGKVSAEDYRQQRQVYVDDAAVILRQIDEATSSADGRPADRVIDAADGRPWAPP
jgi:hypothetical protein